MLYQPIDLISQKQLSFTVDVCIIGSGAGGAISAFKLSQAGFNVLVLEEGPFVSRNDFNQDEKILLPKLYRWQSALATDDLSIRILQGRSYGGSTTINWMTCLRPPSFVLNQWAEEFSLGDYVPRQLDNHFMEIEKRLNVHPIEDSDHNSQNRIILDGCANLGLKTTVLQNNSDGCIGCGSCGIGCPYDAKLDARLTYLNDALENGANVYTGVRADTINYVSKDKQIVNGTILGGEYGFEEKKLKIESRRIVVACGAIFTPILLQKSGLTKSKALGEYFQIHPVTVGVGQYDRIIDPSYGIPMSANCDEFLNLDGKGYGYWLEVPPLEMTILGVNAPGYGKIRSDLIREQRKLGVILVLVRDGANKKSNGSVKYKRGRPRVNYKLCSQDKNHMMIGLEKALEIHFAAGAKRGITLHTEQIDINSSKDIPKIRDLKNGPQQLFILSAHPMGTARMGTDINSSVVNSSLEMHHYPGIYVMDGSVLPTALGVNPMITIYGVVSRGIEISNNLGL